MSTVIQQEIIDKYSGDNKNDNKQAIRYTRYTLFIRENHELAHYPEENIHGGFERAFNIYEIFDIVIQVNGANIDKIKKRGKLKPSETTQAIIHTF